MRNLSINLYRIESVRNELEKCCRDYKDPNHDLVYPNIFNSEFEEISKIHPEWFKDWEGDIPFDKIDDPLDRANEQLYHINSKIKEMHQKLFGVEDQDQQSLIDEILSKLNVIILHLKQNSTVKSYVLLWLIFVLLIVAIFVKI